MTRKKTDSNARKPRRRKQHAQPRRGYKKHDAPVSRSLVLAVVLLVGATAWALHSLNSIELDKHLPKPNTDATAAPIVEKSRDATGNEKMPSGDRANDSDYDFYVMLKDFEVIVRDDGTYRSSRSKKDDVYYLIQAGSFKTGKQAERRRAELALLGLAAKVDNNTNSRGEHWYRVRLGPFGSRRAVAETRGTMIDNGIEAMVMTRKK